MMKRALVLIGLVLLAAGTGTAIYDPNSTDNGTPDDGKMRIMSGGSSASASTSVGENGTEWKAEVSMVNRSPSNNASGTLENTSFTMVDGDRSVAFTGHMQVPTPCHTIDHDVAEQENNTYTFNVMAHESSENGTCAQMISYVTYDGSFQMDDPFKLVVQHDGTEIDTIVHPDWTDDPSHSQPHKQSLLSGFISWLNTLF